MFSHFRIRAWKKRIAGLRANLVDDRPECWLLEWEERLERLSSQVDLPLQGRLQPRMSSASFHA
jgi:hypothetical protein